MTPEALRAYLITRHVDEDIAQDVLVAYLAARRPIRFPKSWGYRVALNRLIDRVRHTNHEDVLPVLPVPPLCSHEASPLRQAEARQELARALKRGPYKRRVVRFKQSQEDYQALDQSRY